MNKTTIIITILSLLLIATASSVIKDKYAKNKQEIFEAGYNYGTSTFYNEILNSLGQTGRVGIPVVINNKTETITLVMEVQQNEN